jgi:hypothetical protein
MEYPFNTFVLMGFVLCVGVFAGGFEEGEAVEGVVAVGVGDLVWVEVFG